MKYQVLFYKGEPLDITREERGFLIAEMNNQTKKFVYMKKYDRVIMFGNIAGIDRAGLSYDGGGLIDMPYNSNQIEEPQTYVKPETKQKMDEMMEKFKNKLS